MAAKRRSRRPRSDDSEEIEEDGRMSGEICSVTHAPAAETIVARKPSLPEDVGAQVSPARKAPRDEVLSPPRKSSKAAKARKRVRKALSPSPEERAQDGAGDCGEASPVTNATADETPAASPARRIVASPDHKETGAMPNGDKKSRAPPPQKGVHADKLVAGAGADATGQPPAETPVERSWSQEDELKILTALFKHAQSHNGALPESSHLLANLTFDKTDANEDKLNDKIRKLRVRYHKLCLQGCPTDKLGRRLFELSKGLWGQVNEDEPAERTSLTGTSLTREFSELSKLYPYLANEVKVYAETHCSGDLIMAAFKTIGDRKARDLDARCKKQRIDAFKLEVSQADLTNEMLSALSSQIN